MTSLPCFAVLKKNVSITDQTEMTAQGVTSPDDDVMSKTRDPFYPVCLAPTHTLPPGSGDRTEHIM
jgi:hypothetical protein